MDDFVIHRKLTAPIVDDHHAHAPTAVGEGFVEPRPQPALVNDRKPLLDVARLGHCHHAAIVADVKDAVLLEDGAEHVLNDDRRGRVRHETGFFVELLGKEIHAEVAVLARLSRSGDPDDLADAALQDQQVADPDMVARDRDGVRSSAALDITDVLTHTLTDASGTAVLLIDDYLLSLIAVAVGVEGVEDTVGCLLEAMTEGMVAAFVVVVAHFRR